MNAESLITTGIESAKKLRESGLEAMDQEQVRKTSIALLSQSEVAMAVQKYSVTFIYPHQPKHSEKKPATMSRLDNNYV